ncbi:MAG: protein phosphatase 2C domain-containing protein [Candidatus Nanopelagicaceae bacterium]|nr:protein phosphatase 2C domain-containing protein [Candidatus Nanopelagicaceae bacterium]
MSKKITAGFATTARSVVGLVRSGNEDSALIHPYLLAVADGMGGHAGGEVASSLAVKTLAELVPILEKSDIDNDSIEDLLLSALQEIDSEIGRVADQNEDLAGMGTTLSALMMYGSKSDKKVALLHVGDSRCYRLRGNTLIQISHDHTVLQELLDQGSISSEEAYEHPQKSFLTQALMGDGPLSPVLMIYQTNPKDRFLLCSDGLSGVLSEKEIKSGLKIHDREDALTFLVDAAYSAGAPDNVTVILADIARENTEMSSDTVPVTFPVILLGAALDATSDKRAER